MFSMCYLQHRVLKDLFDGLQLLPGLSHVLLDDLGLLVDLPDDQVDLHILAAADSFEMVIATSGTLP